MSESYYEKGEKLEEPEVHASVDEYFNGDIEEYGYLYTEQENWAVKAACGNGEAMDLK